MKIKKRINNNNNDNNNNNTIIANTVKTLPQVNTHRTPTGSATFASSTMGLELLVNHKNETNFLQIFPI